MITLVVGCGFLILKLKGEERLARLSNLRKLHRLNEFRARHRVGEHPEVVLDGGVLGLDGGGGDAVR